MELYTAWLRVISDVFQNRCLDKTGTMPDIINMATKHFHFISIDDK